MNLQVIRAIQNMVIMMVGRCVLKVVNDSKGLQTVQVQGLATEILDGIDRMQDYGFTSHPKAGAQGIMVSVGGSRDNAVVIAMDDRRYRVELEQGEVALYDDQGQSVKLKRGRVTEINTDTLRINAATRVEFNTPEITNTGTINSQGDVVGEGTSLHNHTHTGDSGGTTSPPN